MFWSLLTDTDTALIFEAQDMGKLGPVVAQDNLALPC